LASAVGVRLARRPDHAAPDHEVADPVEEPRIQRRRGREVGERSDPDDCQVVAVLGGQVADQAHRVVVDRPGFGLGQVAGDSARPVDLLGRLEVVCERRLTVRGHGHVAPAEQLQHRERVVRGVLEGRVAGDRRDPDDVEGVARERQRQRDRVVTAGVSIEQDGPCHRSPRPPPRP